MQTITFSDADIQAAPPAPTPLETGQPARSGAAPLRFTDADIDPERPPDFRVTKEEWRKLGPETKKILFPKTGQIQELDHFFLLAKRVAENPNPSGTAHTLTVLNVTGVPPTWALAKLLYTPWGVKALTRGLFLELSPTAATKAARTIAIANLLKAARDAGVSSEDVR